MDNNQLNSFIIVRNAVYYYLEKSAFYQETDTCLESVR